MFKYLLPNKYKKVGWVLIFGSLVFMILSKNSGLALNQIEDIGSIIALIGFVLTIMSKEKVEDERTMYCRFKAISMAFFVFISGTLVSNLFDLFDPFRYIFSSGAGNSNTILGTPMGLLYLSACIYYLIFRGLIRNEE